MKVLHIAEKLHDGSTCAEILHAFLPQKGIDSEFVYFEKTEQAEDFRSLPLFLRKEENGEIFFELTKTVQQHIEKADLIHLHTTREGICGSILPYLKARKKAVVWSVDSCHPYTGRCGQRAAVCEGWQAECNPCPLAGQKEIQQQVDAFFAGKKDTYKDWKISVVSSNRGMSGQLKKSLLQDQLLFELPPLLSSHDFYAGDRKRARQLLGYTDMEIVVFCAAVQTDLLPVYGQLFLQMADGVRPVSVIFAGAEKIEIPGCQVRSFLQMDAAERGLYLRAADVYLDLSVQVDGTAFWEAAACACVPVISSAEGSFFPPDMAVVLDNGKKWQDSLAKVFSELMVDVSRFTAMGAKVASLVKERADRNRIFSGYERLYRLTALQPQWSFQEDLPEQIAAMKPAELKIFFEKKTEGISEQERKLPMEELCLKCLDTPLVIEDAAYIWKIVMLWLSVRKDAMQFSSTQDKQSCLAFILTLREKLTAYFDKWTLRDFWEIDEVYASAIVTLWERVFLEMKAVQNIESRASDWIPDFSRFPALEGYPFVPLYSMYMPYWSGKEKFSSEAVIGGKMPQSLRYMMQHWLISLPLYNANERNRKAVLHYVESFCQSLQANIENYSKEQCQNLIASFMSVLWRVSYLGGDNHIALKAYGDFLQSYVRKFFPMYSQPVPPRKRNAGEKIRVGYVSLRFRQQAVSLYMANRIFCHDREKFFVKSFILNKDIDDMTKRIEQESDEAVNLSGVKPEEAIAAFAREIKESDLDILIYADIGMDNITYSLGAMHLAPVQAVLVGHGTTTGLSSLDYYISGDHEPKQAQQHYIEQLICLPNLGCVQIPPQQSRRRFERAAFGLPEDAVVFISCANGLKHVPERDQVLIDILKKADQAYIVLKPFQNKVSSDMKFVERIKEKAQEAGVEDRLIFVPALEEPGDLMGLLVLADIQLDTYPYGGWTTNLEALYYHLPIVTQEGEFARSRWGAGLLRSLGIHEGIARNDREYVKWAVKYASDTGLRNEIKRKIADSVADKLFNGPAGQAVYEEFLQKICK